MKILILEDDPAKAHAVKDEIRIFDAAIRVEWVDNFRDYHSSVHSGTYDLLIVDLMVLDFPAKGEVRDMTEQIIEVTRDVRCPNARTPVLALTQYDSTAEASFKDLNGNDITVLTFEQHSDRWKDSLKAKITSCRPPVTFDFVIICALPKESSAFAEAGYSVGERRLINGLICSDIAIGTKNGAIITAPRMGLVNSAIICTQAILQFKPKLICMSGICAGVNGRSKIYDVVLPEICHQNDSGKWTENGFIHEGYSVQLDHGIRQKLAEAIDRRDFRENVSRGIVLRKSEIPDDREELQFDIFLAPTSSGSSVVADEVIAKDIVGQHRKLSAFEMESFSLYEAARLAPSRPKYFSAKAVVDDGTPSKGDGYHRVAAILAARTVYESIRVALVDEI